MSLPPSYALPREVPREVPKGAAVTMSKKFVERHCAVVISVMWYKYGPISTLLTPYRTQDKIVCDRDSINSPLFLIIIISSLADYRCLNKDLYIVHPLSTQNQLFINKGTG